MGQGLVGAALRLPCLQAWCCWEKEGLSGHLAPPGLAVSLWVLQGLSVASPQFQLLLPCLQGVLGPGGRDRGPRQCGRTGRRKGELLGAMVPLACSVGGLEPHT